ncbi:MAG: hypothetical protein AB1568_02700 [Thermodesulfobacteriota bacterium]
MDYLVIALLIAIFALVELAPGRKNFAFPPGLVPLGGLLSSFFGGLSGHQGALRTAFLLRAGLGKEAFLGTMVLAAVAVDLSRMLIYGSMLAGDMALIGQGRVVGLAAAGTLAAFSAPSSAADWCGRSPCGWYGWSSPFCFSLWPSPWRRGGV